jgi:TetR/AcrR family transcriptional repressor of nem operon
MPQKTHSKRAEILRAVKELLWERGYEAMSPRDVLDRSGAGQGSLYHHFPGKVELACVALNEMAAEERAAVDVLFAPDRKPLDRIYAYLNRERDALRGCRLARLANESVMENLELRKPVKRFLEHIIDRLRSSLEEAQFDGDLLPDFEAAEVATTLLAVVEGGFVLARTHWDANRMKQALGGATQLLRIAERRAR